jgi:hypothetical protein
MEDCRYEGLPCIPRVSTTSHLIAFIPFTTASNSTQLAFMLNLQQHWFTLRRFGSLNGQGVWFNLNSFLPSPEWVGGTYLGKVLERAEQDGTFSIQNLLDLLFSIDSE